MQTVEFLNNDINNTLQSNNNFTELMNSGTIQVIPLFEESKSEVKYYLLNYLQDSKYSKKVTKNPLLKENSLIYKECRGIIVEEFNGKFKLALKTFTGFDNYDNREDTTDKVSKIFNDAIDNKEELDAIEKLDGTLLNLAYVNNNWYFFTRKSLTNNNNYNSTETFQSVINQLFGNNYDKLNKSYTYVFELLDTNRMTTIYNSKYLALLSVFDNSTATELTFEEVDNWYDIIKSNTIIKPNRYKFSSFNELDNIISTKSPDFEGFVIYYKGLRLKYKSKSYMKLFHSGGINPSDKDLLSVVISKDIDEYKLIFDKLDLPEDKKLLIYNKIDKYKAIVDDFYNKLKNSSDYKDNPFKSLVKLLNKNPSYITSVDSIWDVCKQKGKYSYVNQQRDEAYNYMKINSLL